MALILAGMSLSPVVRTRVKKTLDDIQYHLNADPDLAWGKAYSVHQDRFYMWRGALGIIKDHPLLGVGTGGYTKELAERGDPKLMPFSHPHSNILYMTVNYGLVGLGLFIWFFVEMFRNSWPCRRNATGFFVFSTALVILTTGIFNTQIINAGSLFLLAMATGLQERFATISERTANG
jgi:O-antigen ligase